MARRRAVRSHFASPSPRPPRRWGRRRDGRTCCRRASPCACASSSTCSWTARRCSTACWAGAASWCWRCLISTAPAAPAPGTPILGLRCGRPSPQCWRCWRPRHSGSPPPGRTAAPCPPWPQSAAASSPCSTTRSGRSSTSPNGACSRWWSARSTPTRSCRWRRSSRRWCCC